MYLSIFILIIFLVSTDEIRKVNQTYIQVISRYLQSHLFRFANTFPLVDIFVVFFNIHTKHLTNLGQMWPKYLSLVTFAYNTFNTPNLGHYSPYELVFGRKPESLFNLDSTPNVKVSGTFKDYYELLNKKTSIFTQITPRL